MASNAGMPDLRKFNVVIYGINYAPELIGVGKYTGEIGAFLNRAGANVTVVTAPPHYPGWQAKPPYRAWRYRTEQQDGVRIYRCPLFLRRRMTGLWRLLAPLTFAITSAPVAFWQILKRRPDTVLAVEPTFFVAPIALVAARLAGARVVLHIQDLEVDAAFAVGHLGKSRWLARFAGAVEGLILRRFDHVVSISKKMIEKIEEKGVPSERISLIRNWVDVSHIFPLEHSPYREELKITPETFVVLYSGNLGAKQGLDVLLEAARALDDKVADIAFVIAGEGPAKADLQRRYSDLSNVRFLPLQPYERLNDFLNLANLHVIPQEKATADLVLPSKLGGMLATGRPIVVTAEPGTELADYLAGAATVVSPGDPTALASAIREARNEPASHPPAAARLALAHSLSRHRALTEFATTLAGTNYSWGATTKVAELVDTLGAVVDPTNALNR